MSSPRAAFSLAACVVLALSLGLKVLLSGHVAGDDRARFDRELAGRLAAQGYAMTADPTALEFALLRGRRGSCRLAVQGAATPEFEDVARQSNPGLRFAGYLWGGEMAPRYPQLGHNLGAFAAQMVRRLGLDGAKPTPVAVLVGPGCGAGEPRIAVPLIHARR